MKLINKNANTKLYFDMDGTIADFNGQTDAVKRFRNEKGFFKNLKPLEKNLQAVKRAIADGYDCYIITASPHRRADNDKIKWLIKYLPEIPTEKVIITRLGECKAHAMKTVNGILFDDYDRNCKEWVTYNNKNRAVQIKADGQILDGIRAISAWTERLINCEIKGWRKPLTMVKEIWYNKYVKYRRSNMTINFLREEKVTITYNSTFNETDFETFCETNNIPTQNLTFEECVKVVRNFDTTAKVKDADGEEISIYYCLKSYMRDMSYANNSEYHDVHDMPFENMKVDEYE